MRCRHIGVASYGTLGHVPPSISNSSSHHHHHHHMTETEAGLQRNTTITRRMLRKILELHHNSAVHDATKIALGQHSV